METIIFHCETVTPMFIAGADGTTLELRAPSIKGALRFWWRALHGNLPLSELQKKEVELFGGSYKEGGVEYSYRSKMLIHVECDNFKPSLDMPESLVRTYTNRRPPIPPINILYYLAYGHTHYTPERRTHMIHSFIPPLTKFQVHLSFQQNLTADKRESAIRAFSILSKFGGLGSKSRNGFGCFSILEAIKSNQKIELPRTLIQDLKTNQPSNFSSFSTKSKVYKTTLLDSNDEEDEHWLGFDSWHEALGTIGKAYQNARENLDASHHTYTNRLHIAQPIEVKGEKIPNFLERHSKPFFFSVSKNQHGKFMGRVLFMPYTYLESNPDLSTPQITQHRSDYDRETNRFCNLFLQKDKFKEVF